MYYQKADLRKMVLMGGVLSLLLLAFGTSTKGIIQADLVAGANTITIDQTIDGSTVSRIARIVTPQDYDSNQSYPLLFAFHGAGGNANQFVNNINLNQIIDTDRVIGVYPNGHSNDGGNGGFWNLGTEPTTADDVGFVNLIMQRLATYPAVNVNRAYALGFSNGAGMVNLLGKSTDYFSAIAPLFSQQLTSTGELEPKTVLSVFQVNGDIDNLIPLNGGPSTVGEFMSAKESALNWASNFNCDANTVEENVTWVNTPLDAFTYSNCDGGHEVKYLIAFGTGHGWQDAQTDSVSYSEIWSFFKQH